MSTTRKLLLWAAVVVLAILAAAALNWLQNREPEVPDGHSPDAEAATVVRVVDADTIVVERAGVEERVRLLNIDTPETVHPNEEVECGGPQASERISELVEPGDVVVLEFDQEVRDQYDRLLAGVYVDDVFINERLAREGWGEPAHYAPNDRFLEQIEAAWESAEAEEVGVFSQELDCAPG
ncbi:MAG: thermonuclease family protein [Nesterenkonia sp.]